ncbi:MAG: NADH dehydrogenase subunit L [Candidatus Electronema aureum]|uniref:NADH dehydrogenase subunit L n=1 Tax=Candidatus Electronema aureum TaxID=2005002 RepID=A0A521G472_9BACT|nr:MAG: NADH dehydrogenase subunit L [Candidatus Electronema aureum]
MADFIFFHSYLILLFPLFSFAIIGLGHINSDNKFVAKFAITMSSLSLGYALLTVLAYLSQPKHTVLAYDAAWLNFAPGLTANLGMYLDPISVMMLVVVTVISLLVNIYSVGYMKGDRSFNRFFALLALFTFSMLGLVTSGNIFQMFVFWELVGVSSYSLIGFWYEKPSAVAASKKAFIITRFADAFFLLGILLVSFYSQTFSFQELNSPSTALLLKDAGVLTLGTLLIFCGGWGKSAMFPLHIWLPDAMEGPTPVSSIIHSATMVVAGVYLTARMFPLFAAAETTLFVIQCVGAFTALFAAVIAITQMDIKRILAFSTLSQLGYMIFSLGAAKICTESGHHGADVNPLGYSAAMYHVFTHAFFKCMLFLGAGAVIHAVHSNDILKMGGLKQLMPKTYWSLLAACLAIAGVFPLSGFWSKDAILLAALQSGHTVTFLVGLITGGLTAFYMFRFFFLIFHGEARSHLHHVHEDPWMTWPIVALTVPTIFAGLLEHSFVAQVLPPHLGEAGHFAHPAWLPWLATLAALTGIGTAWLLYGEGKTEKATALQKAFGPIHTVVQNKFYIDELYLFITHKIIFNCVAAPIKWFDRNVVDGTMNLCGWLLQVGGKGVRLVQNGQLHLYLGATVLGLIALLVMGR